MWLEALVAFAVCGATLALLLRFRARLPMDHPNARSLHATPTPRIGGLGMIAGVAAAQSLADAVPWPPLIGAAALALLSYVDDLRGLSAGLRFGAHFAVAAGVLWALGVDGWALAPLILAVVWMTNLYNFMDGADGLAGAMAVAGFGALAVAAGWAGAEPLMTLSLAVAAAAVGFLAFNFPPARLFLGDAGSVPLGFLAAAIGVAGVRQDAWPGWFPLLAFSPFIVDATLTLLRRLAAGEKVWQAHRTHYYQRAVRLGLGRRPLAWLACAWMLASAALALALLARPRVWPLLVLWAGGFFWMLGTIDRRWRARSHAD